MDRLGNLSAMVVHACSGGGGSAQAAAGGFTQRAAGGGGLLGFSIPGLGIIGFVTSLAVLAIVATAVAVALALDARQRPRVTALVPVDAQLSPDGHYWWDGAHWRPRR